MGGAHKLVTAWHGRPLAGWAVAAALAADCGPVLVVTVDLFNSGPAELIVVLSLTSTVRDIPLHVRINKG